MKGNFKEITQSVKKSKKGILLLLAVALVGYAGFVMIFGWFSEDTSSANQNVNEIASTTSNQPKAGNPIAEEELQAAESPLASVKIQAYEVQGSELIPVKGGQTKNNPVHVELGKKYIVKMDWSSFLEQNPGDYETHIFGPTAIFTISDYQVVKVSSKTVEYRLRIYFQADSKIGCETILEGDCNDDCTLILNTSKPIEYISAE